MKKKRTNNLSLVPLAALVIASLVLSACKRDTKIEDTAISLKELKEIGELVTAEYYGEVVEALSRDFIAQDLQYLKKSYMEIREVYSNIGRIHRWPSKRVRKFKRTKLHERAEYKTLKKVTKNFVSFSGDKKFLEEIIWKKDWKTFYDEYKDELVKYSRKKNNNVEIVYLGRGWVRAGFDLTSLDSTQLEIKDDTLFINDFDPQIFDADINPWFIPNKTKGFELVRSSREGKITFEQITAVKRACKQKLRKDAVDRGIHHRAREAAEEAFETFLNTLEISSLGGKPFSAIIIEYTDLFEDKIGILYDNTVDSAEVDKLRYLIDFDEKYSTYEADVLNEIDRVTTGHANTLTWKPFLDSLNTVGAKD
ncbi:MAG: DUF4230 domain-containing protein [Flammeovirgaceae bacterium]